jgi:hypothetical protein
MSEGLADAILFGCAVSGTIMLGLIANHLEKVAKALERIANRDR